MGFNFTKINVERLSGSGENLKVNTNIDISDVKKAETDFFTGKEELLVVKFKYGLDYEKDYAKIEFEGNLIISVDPKESKDILKEWKNKNLPEEIRFSVFTIILRKVNVRALQLEEEIGLPFHIRMPKLSKQDSEDKK